MDINVQFRPEVYDLTSTEIQITGSSLRGNAKVFINGNLFIALVKDGAFEMVQQVQLEQGDNTFQIDITSKGEYVKKVIEIYNYETMSLRIDRKIMPFYQNETMIPVELLTELKFSLEELPSLAFRIFDDKQSVIVKEGVKEINVNGENIETTTYPMVIDNQFYIPVNMLTRIQHVTALIKPDTIIFTRIR